MQRRNPLFVITACVFVVVLCSGSFPFRKKKYETRISKDTLQPDKVLFDRAINNIEHGNYEVARLTLNTLINTYDTSEYLAKAKLAIADSWYREGGAHGLAQAEAEYKDFILFYPNMEEAAQSQYKVCQIHYKQMEKADRDSAQATRAEDECRQVMTQFPNSKFVKLAEQMLRNTQEVLAEKEFRTGDFYHHKGSFPAAANRFSFLAQQYPLYSGTDQALWELADAYRKMGDRFENQESDALARIVKDYPLSSHTDEAKDRLAELKRPIPQADADAYARQKYELENRQKEGIVSRALGLVSGHPDVTLAAKTGAPAMKSLRPPVPVSVPAAASGGPTGVSDVVAGQVSDTSTLDQGKDARLSAQNAVPAAGAAASGTGEQKASVGSNGQDIVASPKPEAPPPTNHPATAKQIKEYQKAQERAQKKAARQKKSQPTATQSGVPATSTTDAQTTQPATKTTPPQPDAPKQ
jgi:outer membrane protein assembly factor BamD